MAVFAKDGIEVQNLLLDKPELVEPPETILEEEIHGETDAQKKKSKEPRKPYWVQNRCQKAQEKAILCNSVAWVKEKSKVRD